jgi:uncharacterized OB-fold protein
VIGTALSIEQNLLASDVGGSQKAGTSALIAGLNASKNGGGPALVAAADKRLARVASANELNYGDGAAALLCGTENVIANLVGHHSVSMDFVDHFRGDETDFDYGWEERWIRDEGYSKIVPPAIKAALGACKLKGSDITHFIMPSLMPAVPKQMAKICGVAEGAVRDMLGANLGDTGARTRWSCWSTRLRSPSKATRSWSWPSARASTSWCSRSPPRTPSCPSATGVSGWLKRRKEETNYMKFLAFNEMLPLDKGMRAEFDKKTALSVLWRKRDMIYGLVGGKCKVCGTVQFPRSQVCVNPNCHAIDSQEPYRMAGLEASVMSFTADSLTFSPDPPAYYGMITFPEGGRFFADFTDGGKEEVQGRRQDAHDLPHP